MKLTILVYLSFSLILVLFILRSNWMKFHFIELYNRIAFKLKKSVTNLIIIFLSFVFFCFVIVPEESERKNNYLWINCGGQKCASWMHNCDVDKYCVLVLLLLANCRMEIIQTKRNENSKTNFLPKEKRKWTLFLRIDCKFLIQFVFHVYFIQLYFFILCVCVFYFSFSLSYFIFVGNKKRNRKRNRKRIENKNWIL